MYGIEFFRVNSLYDCKLFDEKGQGNAKDKKMDSPIASLQPNRKSFGLCIKILDWDV